VIRLAGIDHVHLHVGDLTRSLQFYQEAFGAEEAFRVGELLVFLRLPGADTVIALDARSESERNPPHVGFLLADNASLEEAVEAVVLAGGRVAERGEHAPGMPYAYVADPDGNMLEL
jgi:catechol 2,3-dioxygenase-like lactoylglutathione lyase family enzyme